MTNVAHTATITAYEAKDDTFSALCRDEASGEVSKKLGFATIEEATYAAQMMAWDITPCTYAKINKGATYYANAWSAA